MTRNENTQNFGHKKPHDSEQQQYLQLLMLSKEQQICLKNWQKISGILAATLKH